MWIQSQNPSRSRVDLVRGRELKYNTMEAKGGVAAVDLVRGRELK